MDTLDVAVVFVHPAIGGPDDDHLLDEWTSVPGARGCTPEACGVRDRMDQFIARGIAVFGLSSQAAARQRLHADALGLPYPLLADAALALADDPGLPTFEFRGLRYYRRITLIVGGGVIERVLYPVDPPEAAAEQALISLSDGARSRTR